MRARVLKRFVLVCALLPVLALLAWYAIAFLPHLANMKASSARGLAMMRHAGRWPSVLAAHHGNMRASAVRQCYALIRPNGPVNGMLVWHANHVLWYGASFMHFNDQEMAGILIDCAAQARYTLVQ